jgi:PAS domain S-box-containing protein
MYGYSETDALQMNVAQLLPANVNSDVVRLLEALRRGEKPSPLDVQLRAKGGRLVEVCLTGTPLTDEFGVTIGVALTARDIGERRALEQEFLRLMADEQRRIGQDLHDIVGQELTALGLMTNSLAAGLDDKASAELPLVTKIHTGLRRALGQVRALSRGLIPVEVSAHGLMSALAELTLRIGTESGVRCTFSCREPVEVEDNATATQLYRIAQEAITNALKHGATTHVEVRLERNDGRLILRIADHGVGIATASEKVEGLGLKIMRYRAECIRATLTIEATAESGTVVVCILRDQSKR